MATLTRMADFDMKVGKHLQNVYASLCLTILAAAAGAFAHMNYHFGGGGTCMGVFLIGLYLHSSRNPNGNFDQTRFLALLALGFLKGASIGGLIQQALYIDTSIVVTALLATAVPTCISVALSPPSCSTSWLQTLETTCLASIPSSFMVHSFTLALEFFADMSFSTHK